MICPLDSVVLDSNVLGPPCALPGYEGDNEMTTKRQADRHPPGYVCPKRRNKRAATTYLDSALFAAMQEIAERRQITIGDTLTQACHEFASRHSNSYNGSSNTSALLQAARATILPVPPPLMSRIDDE
jgi:hypothetical protein